MSYFREIRKSEGGAAVIRVVGVGGAGNNIVNRIVETGVTGVEVMAVNTDLQALGRSIAHRTIQIGPECTNGLGAGSNPEIGRQAAEESMEIIQESLEGSDLVFITAGLGGGTGTGAAPVIARVCKEKLGALTVGVVCMPFGFEGDKRAHFARKGWENLKKYTDTIITIENNNILLTLSPNIKFEEGLLAVDNVLVRAVRGITDIINTPGHINPDFADIKEVMAEQGEAFMGVGEGEGENRIIDALQEAKESPLLKAEGAFGKARRFLINVTCREGELSLLEVNKIGEDCKNMTGRDALTIFGLTYDDSLGDRVRVTMIATGLEEEKPKVDYDHSRPRMGGRRSLSSQARKDQTPLFDMAERNSNEPPRHPAGGAFDPLDERGFETPAYKRINKD